MKKVTELTEANEIKDEDILMIVQNGENKQVKANSLIIHKYTMTITADTELGAEVTLPFWYKVR